jgi:hypothetical protein
LAKYLFFSYFVQICDTSWFSSQQWFTFTPTAGLRAEEDNTKAGAGAVVGTLTDPNATEYSAYTYALVPDPASLNQDVDNAKFELDSATRTLKLKADLTSADQTEQKDYKSAARKGVSVQVRSPAFIIPYAVRNYETTMNS